MDSEEDTSCCCCCTGSGNKNRGHRRKAKKGRFCSCFGDSNPPREFEDEIYSEICSNNHSGKECFFLFVKNFKKLYKRINEYVLYYHSGRKTLRVFRVSDGVMIANYRVPADLTAIESTTDGKNIVLGMVDGNLTVLTIADPIKPEMKDY